MVYGLLGRQSLVLIHFHQTCDQALGCWREMTKGVAINTTRRGDGREVHTENRYNFILNTKDGTWIRDFVPVRRVKLIIACEDFPEQVLIVVFIIIFITFVIERGVTRQPGGPGIIKTSMMYLVINACSFLHNLIFVQLWWLIWCFKWSVKIHLPCSNQWPTYRMYIMTPVAQQSTGLPYLCLPTTSGAAQEHTNLVISATTGCNTSEKVRNILSPRYSGVPQGSLISPFSSLARWKSLMTILECFRRL